MGDFPATTARLRQNPIFGPVWAQDDSTTPPVVCRTFSILGGVHNHYTGEGIGSVQAGARTAITFSTGLTGPSLGRPNSYYIFRPAEQSAHCRSLMPCPPVVMRQMPDATATATAHCRRQRTTGVCTLQICANACARPRRAARRCAGLPQRATGVAVEEIEMCTFASVKTKENEPEAGISWGCIVPLKGLQRKIHRRPGKYGF